MGQVVPEGKDDEDLLELIRTENMKRQMAMYSSQDHIRGQVESALDLLQVSALTPPPTIAQAPPPSPLALLQVAPSPRRERDVVQAASYTQTPL